MSSPESLPRSGPPALRKTTACEGCRKQKIRCHMTDSTPPCQRCKSKRMRCIVNRMIQVDDVSWKEAIEQKIQNVEEKLGTFVNQPIAARAENALVATETVSDEHEHQHQHHVSGASSSGAGMRIVIDLESSPASVPGLYVYHAAHTRPKSPPAPDLISRGIVTLENARKYQAVYVDRLDHFLYGILGDVGKVPFEQLQQRSPLLSIVVCAVGALHLASPDFEALCNEFVDLSTRLCFAKRCTTDDVQALCIGAFWISDLSSSLVSIAVRIATELQLYRSLSKALQGDRDSYLNARLYFLVYACDHQISIPHGRPPITRNCEAVQNVQKLLDCKYADQNDARLVSHVLRWQACESIYDTLGANVDRRLSHDEVQKVRRFSITLDSLRVQWGNRFLPDEHVGNYPQKGVGIQHHFAKLFLFSHVFRGLRSSGHVQDGDCNVDLEVYELASSAVLSAMSILRTVTSDVEIQSYLNGLPTYFHVMIAFAVVFLLKVSTRFNDFCDVDTHEVQRLMAKLIVVLKDISSEMHPRHLLVTITKCTEDALQQSYPEPNPAADGIIGSAQHKPPQGSDDSQLNNGGMFTDDMVNQFFDDYDFLMDYIQDPGAF